MERPKAQRELYDTPRNQIIDAGFARGMSRGMVNYEKAVSKKKQQLFKRLGAALPRKDAVLVEVGMGTFPNAQYLRSNTAPSGVDIIGVDPNDSMASYAEENAKTAGLSVRIAHGVAEALPLDDGVADAVVCTLTLCSVPSPEKAVSEIRRVLKPGGSFLFLEHVLSQTDQDLAEAQRRNTPLQVMRADGCHLDRRTLETIRAGSFAAVDGEYFDLDNFGYLNPTVAGIALA